MTENKLQNVLADRLPGAFIHTFHASPKERRRAGILAIRVTMINLRKEFQLALDNPEDSQPFPIGPYDILIRAYRASSSAKEKRLQTEVHDLKKQIKLLQGAMVGASSIEAMEMENRGSFMHVQQNKNQLLASINNLL